MTNILIAMDKNAAVLFYVNGFIDLGKRLEEKVKPINFDDINTSNILHLMPELTRGSDYWQDKSTEKKAEEINRYSELIKNNPTPLNYYNDLTSLMLEHASLKCCPEAKWVAHKLAVACCGKTHLYQDMGYQDRGPVSSLFRKYFPSLAAKNPDNRMRWKKFLYRQFCLKAAIPYCPTASCSECPSYRECYTGG